MAQPGTVESGRAEILTAFGIMVGLQRERLRVFGETASGREELSYLERGKMASGAQVIGQPATGMVVNG